MEPSNIQFVGAPCGQHGPYTFFKAFRYYRGKKTKILSLGEFFYVKILSGASVTICIAELQLLWIDRNHEDRQLSSVRLYFLPENTAEGRLSKHGEDELVAENEKLVLKLDDLLTWIVEDGVRWNHGRRALCASDVANSKLPSGLNKHAVGNAALVPYCGNGHSSHDNSESDAIDTKSGDGEPGSECRDQSRNSPTITDGAHTGLQLVDLFSANNAGIQLKEIREMKQALLAGEEDSSADCEPSSTEVVVLSYPQYCRYRTILRRLEPYPDGWIKSALVSALGGFSVQSRDARIHFCRDTTDHPDLEDHQFRQDHLAPNLKGRPRKKRLIFKKESSIDTDSNDSEVTSSSDSQRAPPSSAGSATSSLVPCSRPSKGNMPSKAVMSPADVPVAKATESVRKEVNQVPKEKVPAILRNKQNSVEETFLWKLYRYMKGRNTPIDRIPTLGFKEVDLYAFYSYARDMGGYEEVTQKRLWKHIYDKLGGNPSNTSAATCTRRHYEKLLLPYERYERGEENKPLPKPYKKPKRLPPAGTAGIVGTAATPASSLRIDGAVEAKASAISKPEEKVADPVQVTIKIKDMRPEFMNGSIGAPPAWDPPPSLLVPPPGPVKKCESAAVGLAIPKHSLSAAHLAANSLLPAANRTTVSSSATNLHHAYHSPGGAGAMGSAGQTKNGQGVIAAPLPPNVQVMPNGQIGPSTGTSMMPYRHPHQHPNPQHPHPQHPHPQQLAEAPGRRGEEREGAGGRGMALDWLSDVARPSVIHHTPAEAEGSPGGGQARRPVLNPAPMHRPHIPQTVYGPPSASPDNGFLATTTTSTLLAPLPDQRGSGSSHGNATGSVGGKRKDLGTLNGQYGGGGGVAAGFSFHGDRAAGGRNRTPLGYDTGLDLDTSHLSRGGDPKRPRVVSRATPPAPSNRHSPAMLSKTVSPLLARCASGTPVAMEPRHGSPAAGAHTGGLLPGGPSTLPSPSPSSPFGLDDQPTDLSMKTLTRFHEPPAPNPRGRGREEVSHVAAADDDQPLNLSLKAPEGGSGARGSPAWGVTSPATSLGGAARAFYQTSPWGGGTQPSTHNPGSKLDAHLPSNQPPGPGTIESLSNLTVHPAFPMFPVAALNVAAMGTPASLAGDSVGVSTGVPISISAATSVGNIIPSLAASMAPGPPVGNIIPSLAASMAPGPPVGNVIPSLAASMAPGPPVGNIIPSLAASMAPGPPVGNIIPSLAASMAPGPPAGVLAASGLFYPALSGYVPPGVPNSIYSHLYQSPSAPPVTGPPRTLH